MHRTGDLLLCPVRSLANIVRRILSYPDGSEDMYINTFKCNNKYFKVSGDDMKNALRAAASVIGESALGFKVSDIGTHSIRSGSAMAMYLDDVPVYTIMLIGRWSSDAFLRYIRKQVKQFSHNVSRCMIKNQHFTHVPKFNPRISHLDPRQRNNRNNSQTRLNMGKASGNVIASLPRFSIWG